MQWVEMISPYPPELREHATYTLNISCSREPFLSLVHLLTHTFLSFLSSFLLVALCAKTGCTGNHIFTANLYTGCFYAWNVLFSYNQLPL